MSAASLHAAARRRVRRFAADENGANLVEFSFVIILFVFLMLAIIDFGRIGHAWVTASKATQLAARLAAVRPPACGGVPSTNLRGTSETPPAFGAICRAGVGVCAASSVTCAGVATNATAQEIFTAVRPLIPAATTIDQLQFSYVFDPDLGFLGGPYVPMVTVEFTSITFSYISQLGAFITAWTGNASTLGADLTLPGMSVSLPGEDLGLGMEG